MTRNKRPYRRRSVMSYPREQWKIIGVFGLLALLFALANCYMTQAALGRLGDRVMSLGVVSASLRDDIAIICRQEGTTLNVQIAGHTLLSLIILVMGGVYLSHKVAGPIFQMNKYLADVTARRTAPRLVRFRKYDFFREFADTFNVFQRSRGLPPDEGDAASGPREGDSGMGKNSGTG